MGAGAFFRPRDAEELGISYYDLRKLVERGEVEQVARGLYRLASEEATELYSLAAVCARIRDAVVCLLSALQYHQIGTRLPHEVWIAIPHKARVPRLRELPLRVVRFSGAAAEYGIEEVTLEGVPAQVTNVARTVVDCFARRWTAAGRCPILSAKERRSAGEKASADSTPFQITEQGAFCSAGRTTRSMTTFQPDGPVSFEAAQAMIASDEALQEALERVNQLDFTLLKRKLVEEQGWTAETCDEVEDLYRKFLALNVRYRDQKICPTGPIDTFWHAHILDTRAYARDCELVFGGLLHHFPYFGMRGPEDEAALERTFRDSVEKFIMHFGIDPTAGDSRARGCSSQRCP